MMTDLHERFGAWLAQSPDIDPARDVALHAAFCPDCQRDTAAVDGLAAIDVIAAEPLAVPTSVVGARAPRARLPARVPVRAFSVVALGVATGLVVVRLVSVPAASGSAASILTSTPTPTPAAVGAVLGATGTPEPSVAVDAALAKRHSVLGAEHSIETPSEEPIEATPTPFAVPPPPTAGPTSTPAPTPAPTGTPEPTSAPTLPPSQSPSQTSSPSPTATPTPTGTPTPQPTETPAPTPTASEPLP